MKTPFQPGIGKMWLVESPPGGGGGSGVLSICSMTINASSYDFSAQQSTLYQFGIEQSGTKLFMVGAGSETIKRFSLSPAWDISSATYDTNFYNPPIGEMADVGGYAFNSDGTKMFLLERFAGEVHSYTLSTGFDLSTVTYDSNKYSPTGISVGECLIVDSTGTKMVILDQNDEVSRHTMSSAWDITTASSASDTFVPTMDWCGGLWITADGTKMVVTGGTGANYEAKQYSLSPAWDISSASLDCTVVLDNDESSGVFVDPTFTYLYAAGTSDDTIYTYDL